MMKPTLRRNGEHMVNVRITKALSRHDVAAILAMAADMDGEGFPASKAAVEEEVRYHLSTYGPTRLDWWSDYTDEDTVAAAVKHLGTLFPEWAS